MTIQLNPNGALTLNPDKRVTLLPYKPRELLPREYITDAELMASTAEPAYLDCECYPNYFCINFKIGSKYLLFECGQYLSFNSMKLSWVMHNYKTFGFNSNRFDLLLLWLAYQNQNAAILKECANDIIQRDMWRQTAEKEYNFKVYDTPHIDLIEVAPLTGSLKLYGARIHSPRIQELPYPDNEPLTAEQINIVRHYNFNDLDETQRLAVFMKERLALRADISARYNENVMSKSDAQIAEAVICKEIRNRTGKYPTKSNIKDGYTFKYDKPSYIRYATPDMQRLLEDVLDCQFTVTPHGIDGLNRKIRVGDLLFTFGVGGLHSCEKTIAYKADDENLIVDRDVTSYYPDIILTLGLYPEHVGPVFLDIYKGFKDERVTAKREKNFVYDKGLKIFINGVSGKLNQNFSRLYSPKSYIQMTLTGQLSILMLVEILVCNGFKVISGNTDGIVIYCKKADYAKLEHWVKFWERETNFQTEETQYSAYYARDVNSYFAIKLDGTVKVKGSYAETGSQSGTQLDCNCQTLICSDAIKAFLAHNTPIEETIKACKDITRFVEIRNVKGGAAFRKNYLGKVVRWIYTTDSQDHIQYVLTGNKVANTEGCQPLMDMPDEWPVNLNYDFYIQRAIDILYDVAYFDREKQVRFF